MGGDGGFWDVADTRWTAADTRVQQNPKRLLFSLMGACNLRCHHCLRSARVLKGTSASRELVDVVLETLLPRCEFLRIGGNDYGEQLLSKQFAYFFERVPKDGPEIHLITNLSVLDDDQARLIAEKVDLVEVSVEGFGPSYERNRGASWEALLDNLRHLDRARSKAPGPKTAIVLSVCALRSHLDELHRLFALRSVGVNRLWFREHTPIVPDKEPEALWHDPWRVARALFRIRTMGALSRVPYGVEFAWKYDPRVPLKDDVAPCFHPWETLSVNSTGSLSACCYELDLGQVRGQIEDPGSVFNTKRFQVLRSTVNGSDPGGLCQRCPERQRYYAPAERAQLSAFREEARGLVDRFVGRVPGGRRLLSRVSRALPPLR